MNEETILREQIKQTILQHKVKNNRLQKEGIKQISLFFVPSVSDFTNEKDDGIVKKIFLEEYRDIYNQEPEGKYAYYFSETANVKEKSLFNFVDCDSEQEKKFVNLADNTPSVELLVKLPKGSKDKFHINTPIGKYTPDFALLVNSKLNNDNRISWGNNQSNVPRIKIFTNETRNVTTSSLIDCKDMTTTLGGKELEEVLKIEGIGSEVRPKPIALIKKIIQISTKPGDLVLDFFAGSGTTGQAVMELNEEDGKECNRQFILVQLPEEIDKKKEAYKAGYKKISDITIERVKRAGEKYPNVDTGFKVLKLTDNPQTDSLFDMSGKDNKFIFTHIALYYGYGLNYTVERIHEKEIYLMKAEIANTKDAIFIMEKASITSKDILNLVNNYGEGDYKFFSRDSALNLELTYNILQHFKQDSVIVF